MIRSRQKGEISRATVGCADQMQPPAEEFLLFCDTIAAKVGPTHFATAPRPHSFADGYRHTVDNIGVSRACQFEQSFHTQLKKGFVFMQLTVEPRNTQATPSGNVSDLAH